MATDWKDMLAALQSSGDIPQAPDAPAAEEPTPKPRRDNLRIVLDRKQRRGKEATIIEGFTCSDDELKEIAASLKKSLGIGGSSRGGEILLQGDVRQKAAQTLEQLGHKTRIL